MKDRTDVDTFDGMMAAIKAKSIADGKTYQFGSPSTSGWYLDGWFRAAGLNVAMGSDGLNTCDWNRTTPSPTGVDVAGALVSLANGDYKNYWKAASDSDCVVATTVSVAVSMGMKRKFSNGMRWPRKSTGLSPLESILSGKIMNPSTFITTKRESNDVSRNGSFKLLRRTRQEAPLLC